MEEMNLRNYAYIGDAVWELFIREKTIRQTENSKILHKITTDKVKASYQAELLHCIEEILTDEEKEIARRARNLPIPIARRSNQAEYRQATAFEALIGWWHEHDKTRLDEILANFSIEF
jgi:ribonuclease-3 family protein